MQNYAPPRVPNTLGTPLCESTLRVYRPVALTSCICKVLECVVNSRLMWFLESESLLSSSQYGFRRARSTAEPLAFLESYITTAFVRHDSVLAIFFNLEKTYDTTCVTTSYNSLSPLASQAIWESSSNLFFPPASSVFRSSPYVDDLAIYGWCHIVRRRITAKHM